VARRPCLWLDARARLGPADRRRRADGPPMTNQLAYGDPWAG
jgi:hypothetical protein